MASSSAHLGRGTQWQTNSVGTNMQARQLTIRLRTELLKSGSIDRIPIPCVSVLLRLLMTSVMFN